MIAAEVYEIVLEPHERRGWARARIGAWVLLTVASFGYVGGPSVGEWVVRRRDDGRVLFRVDAGDEEEAAVLRADLERQLRELGPEDFAEKWSAQP